jgi:hypothetical protein
VTRAPRDVRRFPIPENPANFCSACGRDFSSLEAFDKHWTGRHHLRFPEHEQGRRCLDGEEMLAQGFALNGRGRWFLPERAARALGSRAGTFGTPEAGTTLPSASSRVLGEPPSAKQRLQTDEAAA